MQVALPVFEIIIKRLNETRDRYEWCTEVRHTARAAEALAEEEAKWESTALVTCPQLDLMIEGDFVSFHPVKAIAEAEARAIDEALRYKA
jgi:hypothetical protein